MLFRSLADRVGPPFTTVVTNVPGPPVPIYSTGARLESMMGLVCLTDGMGLGHVVQSYVKEASIAFTACRKLMPDPEFYAGCIEESFTELRDAARTVLAAAPAAAPAAAEPKPDQPVKPARKTKSTGKHKPTEKLRKAAKK